jgi:hypothetical protein
MALVYHTWKSTDHRVTCPTLSVPWVSTAAGDAARRRAYAGDDAVCCVTAMVRNRAQADLLVAEVQSILDGIAILIEVMPSMCGKHTHRVRGLLSPTVMKILQCDVKEVIDSI